MDLNKLQYLIYCSDPLKTAVEGNFVLFMETDQIAMIEAMIIKRITMIALSISLGLAAALLIGEVWLQSLGFGRLYLTPKLFGHSEFILQESQASQRERSIDWFYRWVNNPTNPKGIEVEGEIYPFEKEENTQRILAIGDSGTFGLGVKRQEAWPAVLESSLRKEKKNVEVFNFGIPGALLQDSVLFFRQYLQSYQPDVVIFGIFMANDLNQSVYFKPSNFLNLTYKENYSPHFFEKTALYKFYRLQKLRLQRNNRISDLFVSIGEMDERPNEFKIGDFYEGEVALYVTPPPKELNEAYQNVEVILLELKRLCEKRNIELLITLIPTRSYLEDRLNIIPFFSSEYENVGDIIKKRGIPASNLDFSQPIEKMKYLTKKLHIPLIENLKALKSLPPSRPALINGDDHLTRDGHILTAVPLRDYLLSK